MFTFLCIVEMWEDVALYFISFNSKHVGSFARGMGKKFNESSKLIFNFFYIHVHDLGSWKYCWLWTDSHSHQVVIDEVCIISSCIMSYCCHIFMAFINKPFAKLIFCICTTKYGLSLSTSITRTSFPLL